MNSKLLDQFYTKKDVAIKFFEICVKYIEMEKIKYSEWLEPSAGTGSFYELMPKNKVGIDLEPKIAGVIKANFLDFNLERADYITLGNPPFGKNASLALKFMNKAAKYSVVVAFILPKTFKKSSLLRRVDKHMHIVYEEDVPRNAFTFNGINYDVPCVFQIWVRRLELRIDKEQNLSHPDLLFVAREKGNFAFQRVGVNAGKIKENIAEVSSASHYFIQGSDMVKAILSNINWNDVKYNTAGNPSISKAELIEKYIASLKAKNLGILQ
jgi:predicted RNA methylase